MVDAGRVEFSVGINRASLDRAIALLENRLSGVKDVDVQLRTDSSSVAAAVDRAEQAFSGIKIPEISLKVDTQALNRAISGTKEDVLTLESAIASLNNQRIDVNFSVKRGESELANIEARILKLQRQKVNIPVVTPDAAAQIRKIEADIEKLNAKKIKVEADTDRARTQLNELDKILDDLGGSNADQALEQLQRQLEQTSRAANRAEKPLNNVNGVLQAFKGAASFVALDRLVDLFGELASGVVNFAAETLQVGGAARSAEAAFTTILGSAEEAQNTLQELSDFAATTPFDLPGIRQAGQQLLAFGFEQEELIPTLEAVGNVAAGVNVPFDELAEIYGKARVQGRLFAEDINQLTGRGVPIIGELAAQFGVAETEIRRLVESGQIGFSELEQAFISLTGEGGKFFNLLGTQSGTVVGQISNLGDTVTQFQEQLFRAFEPALGAGLEVLTGALDEAASSSEALDVLTAAGERLADSLSSNPELAERLGRALADLADNSASAFAEILDRIGQALENPENIEAFSRGIENLGKGIAGATSSLIQFLDAVIALIDGLERLGLASSLEDFTNGTDRTIGSVATQLTELNGREITVGFNGQFDGPLSRLLGLSSQPASEDSGVDPSQFVPQQDELDKAVRASREANETIADDSAAAARRAESERNRANQRALEEFKRSQEEAIAAIELAQSNRVAGVLRNQTAGNITQDQADSQIADIEAEAIQERITLREQEITQIEALEERGALSAEEAAKQIADTKQTTSELVVQALEQEIDAQERAKQAALDRLSAESQLNTLRAEQVNIQSDLASTALQVQSSLINAQVSLEQSRLELSRQNLEAKLAEATAAEDVIGVEQVRDQLLVNQQQSIAAEFSARRQQLEIQVQQNQLELERQLILAQIAESEAQIAVQKAQTQGASQQEIQGLKEIAELRKQETEAIKASGRSSQNILTLQGEQLDAEEQLASQRATQERREQAIESYRKQQKDLADEQLKTEKELASATQDRENAAKGIVSALSSLENVSAEDALGSLDQLEGNLGIVRRSGALSGEDASDLQSAIDQAQRLSRGGFEVGEAIQFAEQNADNQFASGILDAVGLGGVNSLLGNVQEFALADSQIEQLSQGLIDIREAVEGFKVPPSVENLTIATPNPVGDSSRVLADLAQQRREAAGVS